MSFDAIQPYRDQEAYQLAAEDSYGVGGEQQQQQQLTETAETEVATTQAGTTAKYEFRRKMQEYSYQVDENEEVYVGAAQSKASAKLQEAVDFARAYMQSNRLYLLQNQLKAIGGGKASQSSKKVNTFKGSTKRGADDVDAGAVAAQAIDLYATPSNLRRRLFFYFIAYYYLPHFYAVKLIYLTLRRGCGGDQAQSLA